MIYIVLISDQLQLLRLIGAHEYFIEHLPAHLSRILSLRYRTLYSNIDFALSLPALTTSTVAGETQCYDICEGDREMEWK